MTFDLSVLFGSILGATIAGAIGFLTTRYDRKLVRMEKHLERHQENLNTVKNVVIYIMKDMYPPWGRGYDGTQLSLLRYFGAPEEYEVKTNWRAKVDELSKFTISKYQIFYDKADEATMSQVSDTKLYYDLKRHFSQLYTNLENYENLVRSCGSELLDSYYRLSENIEVILEKKGFKQISEPKNLIETISTASQIVFNLTLRIPPEDWRNDYRLYLKDQNKQDVDDVAAELKRSPEVSNINESIDKIGKSQQRVIDSIEEVMQKTTLSGRCPYL
jgi:hypothetical protein